MTPMHVMDRVKGKTIRPMDIMILPQVADESFTPHIVLTQRTSIHLGRLRAWSIRMGSQHQFHSDLGWACVRTLLGRGRRINQAIHLNMLWVLLMMNDQSSLSQEGSVACKTLEQGGRASNMTSPVSVCINLHRNRRQGRLRWREGVISWSSIVVRGTRSCGWSIGLKRTDHGWHDRKMRTSYVWPSRMLI